jgi:hypothetical protein
MVCIRVHAVSLARREWRGQQACSSAEQIVGPVLTWKAQQGPQAMTEALTYLQASQSDS